MFGELGKLFSWALLVAAVCGVIYPAFLDEHLSLTQIILSIFSPELTISYAMRVLCTIVVICIAYLLSINRIYRNIPITVISTTADIKFHDADGKHVSFNRTQLLRANAPNVTAYLFQISPSTPAGTCPGTEIFVDTFCDNLGFVSTIDKHGSDASGYEVIHEFGRSLPYRWYMPLIPSFLLKRDRKYMATFIRSNIVKRTQTNVYLNEFNVPNPVIDFTAATYPQHNIEINIHFSERRPSNIKVRRIQNRGVVSIPVENSGTTSIKASLERLQNETLRISWDGPTGIAGS